MSEFHTDEEKVKKIEEKVKRGRERELDDLNDILKTKHGRRFVWRYLEMCKVFNECMTGNNWTFYNEGQRNIGLRLFADVMESDPDAFALMSKENKEAKNV